MALELNTIHVSVAYCVETTASTRPTTGYTNIPNITSISEVTGQPDQLECTDLSDEWKRFVDGVKDTGGNLTLGVNLTAAFKTAWETLVTAYETAKASGKATWFEIKVPNLASFYIAGNPQDLGLPSIEVNNVLAGNAYITINQIGGWAASST